MPITLPDTGTADSAGPALSITQTGEGDALQAVAAEGIALSGSSEGKAAAVAKTSHAQGFGLIADGAVGVGARGRFAGVLADAPMVGVYGLSDAGVGVGALSTGGVAVKARSLAGVCVHARSHAGVGVYAESALDNAVLGVAEAAHKAGLFGYHPMPDGVGAVGLAPAKGGIGVSADGDRAAVQAIGGENGVVAEASRGSAVVAVAHGGHGLHAQTGSAGHTGVTGLATSDTKEAALGAGVHGESGVGIGVRAVSGNGLALAARSTGGPAATLSGGSGSVPAVAIESTGGALALAVAAAGRGGLSIVDPASMGAQGDDVARIAAPPDLSFGIQVGPNKIFDSGVYVQCPEEKVALKCWSSNVSIDKGDILVVDGNITAFPGTIAAQTPSTQAVAAVTGMAQFPYSDRDGPSATGVYGAASYLAGNARAILGMTAEPYRPNQYAGVFFGNVKVLGSVLKTEDCFEIDHPQRPAEQLLRHVAIESDERRTFYDGEVELDRRGAAAVRLPAWFASLNVRPRFQLTPIGGAAPDLHVADAAADGFRIAGGRPGLRVCWQVSAVRADAWAKAHPFRVEIDKDKDSAGTYLHPVEHGEPESRGAMWPDLEALRQRTGGTATTPPGDGPTAAGGTGTTPERPTRVAAPARPATPDLPPPLEVPRQT